MARPSKYKSEYAEIAYNYCLLGATDKELASFFDTSEQTLNAWKKQFPEFLESLNKGKAQADAVVASKLYQRAIGYVHPETKIVSYEGEITDQVDVEKHYAPDTTACIFWLKNRQSGKWRDKTDHEISGDINIKVELED